MFIRSERLFLRPGWPEDRDDLRRLMKDDQAGLQAVDYPWPGECPESVDCAGGPMAEGQEPLLPRFLVTLPGAGGARVIGGAGLFRLAGEVNLACWIVREHGGRGYAGEAVRALLSLARTLGHGRILARHVPGNAAAERLLDTAGFRPTGRLVECAAGDAAGPAREYELVFGSPSDCDDQPAHWDAA